MSERSSSEEYIYSKDGTPATGEESPSGQSAVFEEDEQGHRETQSFEAESKHRDQNTAETGTAAKKINQRGERKTKQEGQLNEAYRDLLRFLANEPIVDNGLLDGGPIQPSQVGASFWSTEEKRIFFSKLATLGPDNLPELSRAVGSKTELEVRAYVLRLQQNHASVDSAAKSEAEVSLAEIPAALEIREACEEKLDDAAENLAQHVQRSDIAVEKQSFGDLWLIDESTAAELESEAAQNAGQSTTESHHGQSTGSARDANGRSPVDGSEILDQPLSTVSVDTLPFANLLRPEAFIGLSRSCFMNGPRGTQMNWQTVANFDMASPTPAMFRSAFEDFYQLTVHFTCRLTQATLMQSSSRLRGKEESHPVPEVNLDDVKTACALLGFKPDPKKYWASLPRRCSVEVITESYKFRREGGNPKSRVKLTLEEAEKELGLESVSQVSRSNSTGGDTEPLSSNVQSSELDSMSDDSFDAAISENDDESSVKDAADSSAESNIGDERSSIIESDSVDKEDAYLDHMDQDASQAEERRLMRMLRRRMPGGDAKGMTQPPKPPKRSTENESVDWSKRMKYEAEWERFPKHSLTLHNTRDGD